MEDVLATIVADKVRRSSVAQVASKIFNCERSGVFDALRNMPLSRPLVSVTACVRLEKKWDVQVWKEPGDMFTADLTLIPYSETSCAIESLHPDTDMYDDTTEEDVKKRDWAPLHEPKVSVCNISLAAMANLLVRIGRVHLIEIESKHVQRAENRPITPYPRFELHHTTYRLPLAKSRHHPDVARYCEQQGKWYQNGTELSQRPTLVAPEGTWFLREDVFRYRAFVHPFN